MIGNIPHVRAFRKFFEFANKHFNFPECIQQIRINGERTCYTDTSSVVFCIFTIIWTGLGSLKAIEIFKQPLKSFASVAQSYGIKILDFCYDTLRKFIRLFRQNTIEPIHRSILSTIEKSGAFLSSRIHGKVIAIIDGTHLLNDMYACAIIIAGKFSFLYNAIAHTIGKELLAGKILLDELAKDLLFKQVYAIVADALYLTKEIVEKIIKAGKIFVVKVKDKLESCKRAYRTILQQAKDDMIRAYRGYKLKYASKIREEVVIDEYRDRKYKVQVIEGLRLFGYGVIVLYVKPLFSYIDKEFTKKAENFFIITNEQNVERAVLMAAERWQAEELFDVIKNEFNIKHDFIYKKDLPAFRRFLALALIAINMLLFYHYMLSCKKENDNALKKSLPKSKSRKRRKKRKRKINFRRLVQILKQGHHEFIIGWSILSYPEFLSMLIKEVCKILKITNPISYEKLLSKNSLSPNSKS